MDLARKNKSLRRSLSKKLLQAQGFIAGKGAYVRHLGIQWHAIDLQVSQYGHGYTMNVGFHYDFLPSLAHLDCRPVTEFGAGSFLLWSRTQSLRGRGHEETWSKFNVDSDNFCRELDFNINESLAVLTDCAVKWADPFWFLDKIPPHVLREEVPMQWKSVLASGTILRPATWAVLPDWSPEPFNLCYLLCHLSIRRGDLELAKEYAEIGVNSGAGKFSEDKLRQLLQSAIDLGVVHSRDH